MEAVRACDAIDALFMRYSRLPTRLSLSVLPVALCAVRLPAVRAQMMLAELSAPGAASVAAAMPGAVDPTLARHQQVEPSPPPPRVR